MTPETAFDDALPTQPLFGIRIHALRLAEAVRTIQRWIDESRQTCRYVVTPNVDHVVMLREPGPLRDAYHEAHLVLADGLPLVWSSRWLRRPLPERVAGSDLIPALFDATSHARPLSVFWLGAAPGVALRAAQRVHQVWPQVETVGCYSPPPGFERDAAECDRILARIADVQPDALVVGLGAPKQELWVHRHRQQIRAKVAFCVGATIDFLAGERRRAPRWMRQWGLEWLHRVASEPRRLVKRYARDAWVFPQILWQQAWSRQSSRGVS